MHGDPRQDVIIVGGGASSALLACQLLRDPGSAFRVLLIERRADVGRGVAYGTANPDHLLNVRAANMSAYPDQPDHFWRWLCARRERELGFAGVSNCSDPFCFVPRRIYGDYIASLIGPLLSKDSGHRGLRIVRGECVSVSETGAEAAVTLADGSPYTAQIVVLAAGYEISPTCDGCYADPWTAPSTAGIARDSRVLILGTGLTMIDYVLTLILSGHNGPIVAMSRRGLLPRPHRSAQPLHIDAADIPFGSDISELLRWLRQLIRAHVASGGDWRSVLDGMRPFNQRIWQAFPLSARRRFLEHARSWWDAHRHRMAPEVEARIETAIASGVLTIVAGRLCAVAEEASGALVHFRRRGRKATERIHVAKIIECRGIPRHPWQTSNPALRSLLDNGLARLDPLRIGIDVAPDCAIINEFGRPSERLFAIGPLTRAAFWETTAVPDIRTQCAELAGRITASIHSTKALIPALNPHVAGPAGVGVARAYSR